MLEKYALKDLKKRGILENKIKFGSKCKEELAMFEPTKIIEDVLSVNENSKMWCIPYKNEDCIIRPYSALSDYEVTENGKTIQTGTAGGAAIGALLMGVTGAIIGSSMAKSNMEMITRFSIRLMLNDINDPADTIDFIAPHGLPIDKGSAKYKEIVSVCEQVVGVLHFILEQNKMETTSAQPISTFSVADELLKLKSLMDVGVLSQEEFDAQKKKLLNM